MSDPFDSMTRDELVLELRRYRVAEGEPGPDLDLDQERKTAFALEPGRVHRHSALALALASPYGGKGTREPEPYRVLPELTARQAGAEYRELLGALVGMVEAVDDSLHYGALAGLLPLQAKARAVLRKHNRPRP